MGLFVLGIWNRVKECKGYIRQTLYGIEIATSFSKYNTIKALKNIYFKKGTKGFIDRKVLVLSVQYPSIRWFDTNLHDIYIYFNESKKCSQQ